MRWKSNIHDVIRDQEATTKEKIAQIGALILTGELSVDDIENFTYKAHESAIALCMEALELVSRDRPAVSDISWLHFARRSLFAPSDSLRWESAKLIGNICHLYPNDLDELVALLFAALEENGVVRWSVVYALTQIYRIPRYQTPIFQQGLVTASQKEHSDNVQDLFSEVLNKA